MRDKGLAFDVVLKEAQKRGYARRSDLRHRGRGRRPQAHHHVGDRLGVPMQFDNATRKASRGSQADIRYAEQLGYRIKLLGINQEDEQASSCACIPL